MAESNASNPVLLGYDGSESARRAISAAGALLGGGPAVVLTVWEPTAAFAGYDPLAGVSEGVGRAAGLEQEMDDIGAQVAQRTAEQGADAAREHGFDATARTAEGKIWRAIVDVADEIDARAIAVGTRGHPGLQSLMIGSVANGVVHHSDRPVLVIPPAR
ncbi:MAG TPA: universal stress protein [Solirubrobacteraceae bacterium]|nr:universal stress protein [Solirubrobacteraceae bacterium]